MKENLKVIFTNELDLSIFDEHFYKVILRRIFDLKQKKESQKNGSKRPLGNKPIPFLLMSRTFHDINRHFKYLNI